MRPKQMPRLQLKLLNDYLQAPLSCSRCSLGIMGRCELLTKHVVEVRCASVSSSSGATTTAAAATTTTTTTTPTATAIATPPPPPPPPPAPAAPTKKAKTTAQPSQEE